MKVLLASILVLLGLGGLGLIVVLDRLEPTQAYVGNLVPDDLEQDASDSLDRALAALRSLKPGSDDADLAESPIDEGGPEDSTPEPAPASSDTLAYEIAGTAGDGVGLRSDCRDDARLQGGLAEGASVSIVSKGTGLCEGWSLIEDAATSAQTWVRDRYLTVRAVEPPGDTPTIAAAPVPPATATAVTATPAPTQPPPSATPTPTPSPSPTATPSPESDGRAYWFGRVDGSPGDLVAASIDGRECASTTVYDRDGEAYYYLAIAEDAPCNPTEGATVVLSLNGEPASRTGIWASGNSNLFPLP